MGIMWRIVVIGVIAVVALETRALAAFADGGCSSGPASYTVKVPGRPFSVAQVASGEAFVSVIPETPAQQPGLAVLRCKNGRLSFDRLIPLAPSPTVLSITPDGKTLVVADDSYIAFVDVGSALHGKRALLGYMKAWDGDIEDDDAGAAYSTVTPDNRFAFVSEENAGTVTVIDLQKARASGYTRAAIVRDIVVGNAPITVAFSPDATTAYVTSEVARSKDAFPNECREEGAPATGPPSRPAGVIYVIDVKTAESQIGEPVRQKIRAGCSPVRLSMIPGSNAFWATNRASNNVMLFDATGFSQATGQVPSATVTVGSNPVPVIVTSDGALVLVGNTNRFGPGGTSAGSITVIDAKSHEVLGTIPSGLFPRQFTRGNGSTIFLSNNRSDSVTIFNETRLRELIAQRTRS